MTDSPSPIDKPRMPHPEPPVRSGWAIFAVLTLVLPFVLFASLKARGPMTPLTPPGAEERPPSTRSTALREQAPEPVPVAPDPPARATAHVDNAVSASSPVPSASAVPSSRHVERKP